MLFEYMFSYWWLILPAVVLSLWAQHKVTSTYEEYSKYGTSSGLSGAQAARKILDSNHLSAVPVELTPGKLSDHYDPRSRTLRLSKGVYYGKSVASLGIAAHEAGHAIQDSKGYAPLTIRNSVYPLSSIGSNLGPIMVLVGMFLGFFKPLIGVGILLYAFAVFFSLVTLPVEFDASSRAVKILGSGGMLTETELKGTSKVLNAAAMTYVASALTAIMTLLRLILLSRDE